APAAHCRLEVRAPAQSQSFLHVECMHATRKRRRERPLRGQPLSALSAAIAKHPSSALGAHPAQKAVDAPAIAFLGLIGPFDRASVAEPNGQTSDTACVTSS